MTCLPFINTSYHSIVQLFVENFNTGSMSMEVSFVLPFRAQVFLCHSQFTQKLCSIKEDTVVYALLHKLRVGLPRTKEPKERTQHFGMEHSRKERFEWRH
jgi:hypothetical protein